MSSNGLQNNHDDDEPPTDEEFRSGQEDDRAFVDTQELEELSSEDFPTYFLERDGRLFHSHETAPYPLPVDTPEQQRLTVQHNVLRHLLGANYIGPVPEVLAPQQGRQVTVVDFGTGTGQWPMEMGRDFPHVQFRGLDIVPIATRYPRDNVHFEMHDISEQTRWPDASVDLVHARSISMTVRNYGVVLQEAGRLLRPRGMFFSGEWGRYASFHPSIQSFATLEPLEQIPGVCRFFQVLQDALAQQRGITPVAPGVADLLRAQPGIFTDITEVFYYMPIGPWEPSLYRLGRAWRAALVRYMSSVRPVLQQSGLREDEIDAIFAHCTEEFRTVRGLVSVYYAVYARRV